MHIRNIGSSGRRSNVLVIFASVVILCNIVINNKAYKTNKFLFFAAVILLSLSSGTAFLDYCVAIKPN